MKIRKLITAGLLAVVLATNPAQGKVVIKDNALAVCQDNYNEGFVSTKLKWKNKVIRWYDFSGKIKIVPEKKLTDRMLISRKNKTLYIEKITGVVVNNRLDGRTSAGNYISYSSLKGKVKKGSHIITYCVYSPYTRWTDDIDEIYHIIIKK